VNCSNVMPRKKYIISLSPEERSNLEQFSRTGKAAAYAMTHARILLKADVAQPGCRIPRFLGSYALLILLAKHGLTP